MPYLNDMIARFWAYRAQEYAGRDHLFDQPIRHRNRPPVFLGENAHCNILADPNLAPNQIQDVIQAIPLALRHNWFGSMRSSQALAQSVFGALAVMQMAPILRGLATVDDPEFFPFQPDQQEQRLITLEVEVEHLGEPNPSSLDVVFAGARRVAIECKLMEEGVSSCRRPGFPAAHPGRCNGNYEIQHARVNRCALTEIGVLYWNFLPALFQLDSGIDHAPCPLHHTYQLVRNVLGICTPRNGAVRPDGLAVLLYDERNPAFQPGGDAETAFHSVREALLPQHPDRLHRCKWQALVGLLREHGRLNWLTDQLERKYGF